MAYKRSVKFEYYRVVFRYQNDPVNQPDRLFDLNLIIDKASAMSLEARTYDYYQEQARLDSFYYEQSSQHWFLHFMRLRDAALPHLAKQNAVAESFTLEDDEYLGEDITGLYDEQWHVLMLQRNRNSLSKGGLEVYLNLLWGSPHEDIFLRPILNIDTVRKARETGYYRKLKVRFADLRNIQTVNFSSPLKSLIETFGEYDPIEAEVTITLGHAPKDETLNRGRINDSIEDIVEHRDYIRKAEISGKLNDDTRVEKIDLLEDKLHSFAEIECERKCSIPQSVIAHKMHEIYIEQRGLVGNQIITEEQD